MAEISTDFDPIDEYRDASGASLNLKLWKRLFQFTRPYKREVITLIVFASITGLLEMSFPLLTKWIIDDVEMNGTDANLVQWFILYVSISLMLALCVGSFIWLVSKIRVYTSHDIRRAAFENLQRQSFKYFDYRPVGWIVARLTSDCERLTNILAWGLFDLIWGTTMMLAVGGALMIMHWKLGLLVMSTVPLVFWISAKIRRSILFSARTVRSTNSLITGSFNESIMGISTSKAFTREDKNLNDFQVLTGRMYSASVKNLTLAAIYVPIILTASSLGVAMALAYGGSELLAGVITAGSLIAAMTLVQHFFDPIEFMGHWFAEMQMAQASAERILGVIDAQPDIEDSTLVKLKMELAESDQPKQRVAIDGDLEDISTIELRDVSFSYQPDKPVLHEINLLVERGQTIAFVGPTGGGKTTLVSLISRFYEPTSGRVLLDGVDYRNRSLRWLQSKLGIVLQQAHVFSGSVMENIRYGRLTATDEEVVQAAKLVGADEFIRAFPDGYEFQVGESGNRLSTGQKQLLSYARAILADPQILILDEATSSVDTETEQKIQKSLNTLLQGRFSFVIAHRLSTIRNADRIIFIDGGQIVEQGTHDELMQRKGAYASLHGDQYYEPKARAKPIDSSSALESTSADLS